MEVAALFEGHGVMHSVADLERGANREVKIAGFR